MKKDSGLRIQDLSVRARHTHSSDNQTRAQRAVTPAIGTPSIGSPSIKLSATKPAHIPSRKPLKP